MWAYGTAAIGVVLVRTIKRVIFYEARQYSIDSTRHNYLLLALWACSNSPSRGGSLLASENEATSVEGLQ